MTAPLAGTGYGGRLYTVSERSDTHVHALTYRKGPSAATPGRQPLMEAGDWRRCLCLNSSHGRVPRVETVTVLLHVQCAETPRKRPGPRVVDPDQPLAAASVVAPEERPRWQHRAC